MSADLVTGPIPTKEEVAEYDAAQPIRAGMSRREFERSRQIRWYYQQVISQTDALVASGVLRREMPVREFLQELVDRRVLRTALIASVQPAVNVMSATGRWQITPTPVAGSMPLDVLSSTVVLVPDLNSPISRGDSMSTAAAVIDLLPALPDAQVGLILAAAQNRLAVSSLSAAPVVFDGSAAIESSRP